jgi:hypothetical protein
VPGVLFPRRLCAWRELKGEDLRYRYGLRHSFDQTEALISYVTHRHAPLTPEGRRKLVELVIDGHWVQARVAERLQVSRATVSNGCALAGRRDQLGLPTVRRNRGRHRPGHHFGRNGESSLCGSGKRWGPAIRYHPLPPEFTLCWVPSM